MVGRTCALVLGLGVSGVAHAATFYIDATAGDDARDAATAQTEATPWKTLTRALTATELVDGDTVRVATGAYGAGETFPLPVKSGVTVAGAGPTATVITVPEGATAGFQGNTSLNVDTVLRGFGLVFGGTSVYSSDAFRFEGSSLTVSPTISTVSVGPNFNRGVSYSLTNGDIGGNIHNSTFTGVQRGVDARTRGANVAFRMDGDTVDATDNGVRVIGTTGNFAFAPMITGSSITSDVATAIYVAASSAASVDFAPRITGNQATSNPVTGDNGIYLEMRRIKDLTGAAVIGGNDIAAKSTGVFVYYRTFDGGPGTVNASSHVVANHVSKSDTAFLTQLNGMAAYDGTLEAEISGNLAEDSNNGLYTYAGLSASSVAGTWLLAGNSIASNGAVGGFGIGMTLSAMSNTAAHDGRMQDNIITGADLAAAWSTDYGAQPSPLISGNTLIGNPGTGLWIYGSSSTSSSGWLGSDVGGGSRSSTGANTLTGNGAGLGAVAPFDLVNSTINPISAIGNYWGSSDLAVIDSHIADDDENAIIGKVDFSGALAAEPIADGVVTTTIDIVTDVDPVGLSAGDTVRVNATVEPRGEIGCASAAVGITGAIDGATYVAGSATSPTGFVAFTEPAATPIVALGWIPAGQTASASWEAVVGADDTCGPVAALVTATCAPQGEITGAASADRATTTWYADIDLDTFGGDELIVCSDQPAPTGAVSVDGDCDDDDATSHPGGTEVPDDGIDQDCNGQDLITDTDTDTDADSDSDTDTDTDADSDADTDTDPCDGGGGAAGGGGCCKPKTDTSCAWIVLPFLPLVSLRRRRRS